MNKKILCALPLSFLVIACSQQARVPPPEGCEQRTPKLTCTKNRDQDGTPFVNVTPASRNSGWKVVPFNVCVNPQDKLEINILGSARAPGTVVTYPKNGTDNWVNGNNFSNNKKIILTVPPKPDDRGHADYNIMSTGSGCIDPRLTYN